MRTDSGLLLALATIGLCTNAASTIILVWASLTHRDVKPLRDRANVAVGLTAFYAAGYMLVLANVTHIILPDNVRGAAMLFMVIVGAVPQIYFLYLYLSRQWD